MEGVAAPAVPVLPSSATDDGLVEGLGRALSLPVLPPSIDVLLVGLLPVGCGGVVASFVLFIAIDRLLDCVRLCIELEIPVAELDGPLLSIVVDTAGGGPRGLGLPGDSVGENEDVPASSVTVTVTGSRLEVDWVKVSLTSTPNWHWTSVNYQLRFFKFAN